MPVDGKYNRHQHIAELVLDNKCPLVVPTHYLKDVHVNIVPAISPELADMSSIGRSCQSSVSRSVDIVLMPPV